MKKPFHIVLNVKKAVNKPNTIQNNNNHCPFCSFDNLKNEHGVLGEKDNMLWIKNKYPVLEGAEQTLIIETNTCEGNLGNYQEEVAKDLFRFAFENRDKMLQTNKFKEVVFLKNSGARSDGSVHHAHMQLVGLKEVEISKAAITDSLSGEVAFENEHTKVLLADNPTGEKYEFAVIWDRKSEEMDYVKRVQQIVRYLSVFKNGKFQDYNFYFHEDENVKVLKIIPRGYVSIYLLGFGVKQVPNDLKEIAEELRVFIQREENSPVN